jgi:hypothetical protein
MLFLEVNGYQHNVSPDFHVTLDQVGFWQRVAGHEGLLSTVDSTGWLHCLETFGVSSLQSMASQPL